MAEMTIYCGPSAVERVVVDTGRGCSAPVGRTCRNPEPGCAACGSRSAAYELLVSEAQDPVELVRQGDYEVRVKGRGTSHQVDVLGEFAFTPAFSLRYVCLRSTVSGSTSRRRRGLSCGNACLAAWWS